MCLPRSLRRTGQRHSETQVYVKLGYSFAQGIQSHHFSHVHNGGHLSGNVQSNSHFCLSIFLYPQQGFFSIIELITFSVVSVEELWLQSNYFLIHRI